MFQTFNLMNNYGWRDKTETELTGVDGQPLGLEINVVYGKDPAPDES